MGPLIGETVEKVDGKTLRYSEFAERYMKGNRPVVLTGLMDGWRACTDWVTPHGHPDLSFFQSDPFADSIVQVADCGQKEFTDQKRTQMSVSQFIKLSSDIHSLLYLKDWHFVKEHAGYKAYTTPAFFIDDWLNIYLDSHNVHRESDMHHDKKEVNCSDYRFVYMGAKGTWTPLHADVFRSYSWSANVCGKKRWLLLPPSQCDLVFDRNLKTSVYDVYEDVSDVRFPGFKKAVWWECTQEHNEIIFVPSGWYHQVHNLEDTISINHNWFNAYNLAWVWNLLLRDYKEAKEYIEDVRDICDDFESLCQRNLAANTGMNFYDFFIFIGRFALANLIGLNYFADKDGSISELSSRTLHLTRNLVSIREVAARMESVEAFSNENLNRCSEENSGRFYDLERDLVEPRFLELCAALITTQESIDGQEHDSDLRNSCVKDLLNYLNTGAKPLDGSKMKSPTDIVRLIDLANLKDYNIQNLKL